MKKRSLLAAMDAEKFCQAVEDWIIDNECNPSTPEEWERCLTDLLKKGEVQFVGNVGEGDVGEFKQELKKDYDVNEI